MMTPENIRSPHKGNILVLASEPMIGEMISDYLSAAEFSVDLCQKSEQAFELFKNGCYQIVFCDLKTPQWDGISFFEALRMTGKNCVSAIITDAVIKDPERLIKSDFDAIFRKPFSLSAIENFASKVCEGEQKTWKRIHLRYPLSCPVQIVIDSSEPIYLPMTNISLGGFCAHTGFEQSLTMNARVQFSFFPSQLDLTIVGSARCRWIRPNRGLVKTLSFSLGFQFEELEHEPSLHLKRLISTLDRVTLPLL